jgi:hypothetical protein
MGGGISGTGSDATCHGNGAGGTSAPFIEGAGGSELSHAGSGSSSGGASAGIDDGGKAGGSSFRDLDIGCDGIPLDGFGAGDGTLGAKVGGGIGCGGGIAAWNGRAGGGA